MYDIRVGYRFRWNAWNVEHVGKHGVAPAEAEHVVDHATRPYPRYEGHGKYVVRGRAQYGRYVQIIYIFDPEDEVFVIHARPLTDNEKRQLRRSRR